MSGTVDPDDEDFEIPKISKNKRKNCNESKKKKKKKKRDWTDELKDNMSKDVVSMIVMIKIWMEL